MASLSSHSNLYASFAWAGESAVGFWWHPRINAEGS